jgi:hypothetical protein
MLAVHPDQLEHHIQQKVGDARAWHSAPCQLIAKTKFDQILDLAMRKPQNAAYMNEILDKGATQPVFVASSMLWAFE